MRPTWRRCPSARWPPSRSSSWPISAPYTASHGSPLRASSSRCPSLRSCPSAPTSCPGCVLLQCLRHALPLQELTIVARLQVFSEGLLRELDASAYEEAPPLSHDEAVHGLESASEEQSPGLPIARRMLKKAARPLQTLQCWTRQVGLGHKRSWRRGPWRRSSQAGAPSRSGTTSAAVPSSCEHDAAAPWTGKGAVPIRTCTCMQACQQSCRYMCAASQQHVLSTCRQDHEADKTLDAQQERSAVMQNASEEQPGLLILHRTHAQRGYMRSASIAMPRVPGRPRQQAEEGPMEEEFTGGRASQVQHHPSLSSYHPLNRVDSTLSTACTHAHACLLKVLQRLTSTRYLHAGMTSNPTRPRNNGIQAGCRQLSWQLKLRVRRKLAIFVMRGAVPSKSPGVFRLVWLPQS